MDEAEYRALIETQQRYYATLTPDTSITAQLIRAMHRDWLGSLYVWAGQYRTVELQKGSFAWPPAWRVPDNMSAFEREMLSRYTPCRPDPLPQAADALANVLAELLLIHPFRDGQWAAGALVDRHHGGAGGLSGARLRFHGTRKSGQTRPVNRSGVTVLRPEL